jgi:hypothetical protein
MRLSNPQDRNEAAEAIRPLVEKIALRPGPNRSEIYATLHGELGKILGWIEAQAVGKIRKLAAPKPPKSSIKSRKKSPATLPARVLLLSKIR